MSDMPRPDARLHATHDPELVAAYAAGDATGRDLAAAGALVAGCTACATLHRDLRAIMAALPAVAAPVRSRDFRLTPEVAATLRRRSPLRRLLAPFATARFAFAGPAGVGLAALGLAGILFSGGLGIPALPGAGSAASTALNTSADPTTTGEPEMQGAGGSFTPMAAPWVAPSAAASAAPVSSPAAITSQDGPMPTSPGDAAFGKIATGATGAPRDSQASAASPPPLPTMAPTNAAAVEPAPASTSPVGVVGLALLAAGLLLAGVRWAARRVV